MLVFEAKDDWNISRCNKQQTGLITLQPVMFENIVMETLHMLREMAANGETEKRKVIDPSVMHSSHTLTFLTTQCMT